MPDFIPHGKYREGDRVCLRTVPGSRGTVDESWVDGTRVLVNVVWDESGCIGCMNATDIRKMTDEEAAEE